MPLVSVIIPTYNHRDLIVETLDSVWSQTFTDYEVIVVNDGSPDDTAAVLRPLADTGRIRYLEQANAGQAAARNVGIAAARGEFIALLDDDDRWPSDKLAWQVDLLTRTPTCVMVYGYYQSFGQVEGAGRFPQNPSGDLSRIARRAAFIGTPGQTLIRATALHAIGGFDAELWGIDDWDLYIRLAALGPILYEDRNALHYRVHAANASKNIKGMFQNALRLREKHFPTPRTAEDRQDWRTMGRWIRRHYAGELQRNASILWREGRAAEAQGELRKIARIDPTFFLRVSTWRWLIGRLVRR